MGEPGEAGEDDEDDPVRGDDRTSLGFIPAVGFTSTSNMQDDLPLFYLGSQLGLTTFIMVGGVMHDVGLVGLGSRMGTYMGGVDVMMDLGQQGAMVSTSYRVSILFECLLPNSVKQESSAFSTYLGNQLGNTDMVRGFQARHWKVVGCSCRVGVFGEAVLGEGSGVDQQQDVAAHGADQLHNLEMQEGSIEM